MADQAKYAGLGTVHSRSESDYDHHQLQALFNEQWSHISSRPQWSQDQIRSWQFSEIQKLVNHSFETVPLYRKKYSAVGFEPGDLKSWDDFGQLPLLTKDELIKGFPGEIISDLHSYEFSTRSSGSSGQFVTMAVSPNAIYTDTLQGIRQFQMQSGNKYGPDDSALFIYTCPWWFSSVNHRYETHFLPTTADPNAVLHTVQETRPRIISLYPTYLERLRAHGIDLKSKSSQLELIVVHSEQSSALQRSDLTQFFGVPVLDEFSSEELTRIALECPSHSYHLEEDACFIEVLRTSENIPAADGELGRIVGTNLLNTATPIIRYSQGDVGAITHSKICPCQSNFRILTSPGGRLMDSIKLRSGDFIPASAFMDQAYNWYLENGIPIHGLAYQIVQKDPQSVEVYLKPERFEITAEHSAKMKKTLYQLLPPDMQIQIYTVSELPKINGFKRRPIISLVEKGDIK